MADCWLLRFLASNFDPMRANRFNRLLDDHAVIDVVDNVNYPQLAVFFVNTFCQFWAIDHFTNMTLGHYLQLNVQAFIECTM